VGQTTMGKTYGGKGFLLGAAGVVGFSGLRFLDQGSSSLRKLHFGKNISTQWGFSAPGGLLKSVIDNSTGSNHTRGIWRPGQERFAAFAIYNYSTANPQYDFGWVRLVYSDSAINGAPDSITAIDWGYDPSGSPVTTGEGISGGPEPSTFALGLLASGALGVAALRGRKKVSA
jgi:PEP-CTERM motif